MSNLPSDGEDLGATEALRRELQNGERVVWVGRATKARLGFSGYLPMFFGMGPFAIVFAFFWYRRVWQSISSRGGSIDAATIAAAIGGLFPLSIGCFMAASPVRAKRRLRKSVYAITDQRAIVLQRTAASFGLTAISFRRDQLKNVRRDERRDGSGDLILHEAFGLWQRSGAGSFTPTTVAFWGIENVRDVEALLRRTLRLDEVVPPGESQSV